jgi:hypothetical protein
MKIDWMTDDQEPNLVSSGKSKELDIDGYSFSIEIYRLEEDQTWTLEVIDQEGTSHVWDEQFQSDQKALDAAITAIESKGPVAFVRGDNVIPFRPL